VGKPDKKRLAGRIKADGRIILLKKLSHYIMHLPRGRGSIAPTHS
jgi:hypothetical protein